MDETNQPGPAQPVAVPQTIVVQQVNSGPARAVTKSRKATRHGLHLVLSVVTLGCWLPVWLILTAWHAWGPKATATTQYYG